MTTRLRPLLAHLEAVTRGDVPKDWPAQTTTIYLCYPLDQVPTAGALLSCIIAACIKTVMRQPHRTPTLFALDELPATALAKLDTYMATLGGYGGTLLCICKRSRNWMMCTARTKAQTILGNCQTKLFYPPRDLIQPTRRQGVWHGTALRARRQPQSATGSGGLSGESHTPRGPQTSLSWSEREAAVLARRSWTRCRRRRSSCWRRQTTQLRVLAERLNPIPRMPDLPAPPALPRRRPVQAPTPCRSHSLQRVPRTHAAEITRRVTRRPRPGASHPPKLPPSKTPW